MTAVQRQEESDHVLQVNLHTPTVGRRRRRRPPRDHVAPVYRYGRRVRESGRRNAEPDNSFLFKRFFSFSFPRDSLPTRRSAGRRHGDSTFFFPHDPYRRAESIAARAPPRVACPSQCGYDNTRRPSIRLAVRRRSEASPICRITLFFR